MDGYIKVALNKKAGNPYIYYISSSKGLLPIFMASILARHFQSNTDVKLKLVLEEKSKALLYIHAHHVLYSKYPG